MSDLDRAIESLEERRRVLGYGCIVGEALLGFDEAIKVLRVLPSVREPEATLDGLTIHEWKERCVASDRDRDKLASTLDGAPVGQVLTREELEEAANDIISRKFGVDTDDSNGHPHIWKVNEDDECVHCGVMWTSAMLTEFRDALLAKFGVTRDKFSDLGAHTEQREE